ncbi:MAG: FAD-dependent oxidoreductase [Campylobacterales bacterium]|nr:FAD-dependent oxidoreductase [Campylobacterales bacterium]
MNDFVTNIDFANKSVICENSSLNYDYLVIANGAKTFFPKAIVGLTENTKDIKTLDGALDYKLLIEKYLFGINKLSSFKVVIGGAGLSGVEIAAELAYKAKKMGYSKNEFSIKLIEPLKTILYGMDEFLIEKSTTRLHELGVDIINGHFISKIDSNLVHLTNNQTFEFDIFIFTGGVKSDTLSAEYPFTLNQRGQIVVDRYLKVGDFNNVFAIGDAAEIKDRFNNILPPTSQIAKQSAKCSAENIARSIGNVRLLPCNAKIKGVMIALGGNYAVGIIFNKIKLSGYIAHLLKNFIFFIHGLSFKNYGKYLKI